MSDRATSEKSGEKSGEQFAHSGLLRYDACGHGACKGGVE
jgi:hypothetical protein